MALDAKRILKEVRRLLNGLGPTPGSVAACLQQAGARGVRARADQSPVGAYLRAVVGVDPAVKAVTMRCDAVSLSLHGDCRPVVVTLPGAVRAFLAAFDVGCYPVLIAPDGLPSTEG